MLTWKRFMVFGVLALVITGCATENYNPYMLPGAGIGAAVGAGIGAAANHSNPMKGAAIGALLGGAGGAVAGEYYGRTRPYPYPPYPQQHGYYQNAPQQGYSYTPPAPQGPGVGPAYDTPDNRYARPPMTQNPNYPN